MVILLGFNLPEEVAKTMQVYIEVKKKKQETKQNL